MEKHNLSMSDMRLSEVSESVCKGVSKSRDLPLWVSALRYVIGQVFGVESMNRVYRVNGTYQNYAVFIGLGDKPAAAQYTYEVLFRQLSADRRRYLEGMDARLKPTTKTRRADLFCEGWVHSVQGKVEAVAVDDADRELINRFKEWNFGKVSEAKTRSHEPTAQDIGAIRSGAEAGSKAQLFRGVGSRPADQQIGETV